MKKLCIMTAIVLSAVMLFSSCGKPKSPAVKLTLDLKGDDSPLLIGPPYRTHDCKTMQEAVELFAAEKPDAYNCEEIHKLVEQFGDFYLPDNGDEILEYIITARCVKNLPVSAHCEETFSPAVLIQHGDTQLYLIKILIDNIPDTVEEVQVGDKTVYYSTYDLNGEDVILYLFYDLENGDGLQILKRNQTHISNICEQIFTIDEISALGEDFFSFKPEPLKDYFGDDYFAEDTEDTQE